MPEKTERPSLWSTFWDNPISYLSAYGTNYTDVRDEIGAAELKAQNRITTDVKRSLGLDVVEEFYENPGDYIELYGQNYAAEATRIYEPVVDKAKAAWESVRWPLMLTALAVIAVVIFWYVPSPARKS